MLGESKVREKSHNIVLSLLITQSFLSPTDVGSKLFSTKTHFLKMYFPAVWHQTLSLCRVFKILTLWGLNFFGLGKSMFRETYTEVLVLFVEDLIFQTQKVIRQRTMIKHPIDI